MVLPLFKSHYSYGKSVLTLEKIKDTEENGPSSIIKIAKDNNLKQCYLVEDNLTGILEAYYNLKEEGIDLRFGLRITYCLDVNDKSDNSIKTNHKIVLFPKNNKGYYDLLKLSSLAATDGFYYEPRLDKSILEEYKDNLVLCIPFYDSFIFNNNFSFSKCLPDFANLNPVFFYEENDWIFDKLLKKKVDECLSKEFKNSDLIKVKSIYYNKKEDFDSYLTMRCIQKRSTWEKPELEFMMSNKFCVESWLEDCNEEKV